MTNQRDDDETLPIPSGGGGDPRPAAGGGRGRGGGGLADGLERPGDEIGPYKLISRIGEGGFGEVWLAERRQPFVQRVALKLIKPGMDSRSVIARFEQERQALAVMNHPGIAKVLDGGMTPKGRPYFAMEFVKGDPVTAFCDARKLSLRDRLELFAQACEAIQHAHLKGIVHRDLKPSNILAFESEGEGPKLKVIDFGVAKAMSQSLTEKTIFTETGQMIGTPEYMSPEQADPTNADIDTRSDIYSLGVLLYELVAGTTPFDGKELRSKAYGEIQRILREEDAPRPSDRLSTISTKDRESASRIERTHGVRLGELARTLRSELEWIPLKAMRKEPRHRYQTAMSLAEDVRNYLDGKPLMAGPESTGYRVRKYVRRHKALVTSAAAVAMALVAGLSVATWQWRVAEAERVRADERAAAAELAERRESERAGQLQKVSDFQSEMLGQIDTTTAGVALMKDLRERFAAALEKSGVPEAERATRVDALRQELVRVNATDTAAALIDRTILRPAIDAIDRQFKDDPATDARLRQVLAGLYRRIGLFEAALPLQESALATRRRVLGDEDPDTLRSINDMGFQLQSQGKLSEAEPYYREAMETRRRVLGDEHPDTLLSIYDMGILLRYQGKLSEAEPYSREALETRRRVLGDEHLDTLWSLQCMGQQLQSQGKLSEAEPYYREALETRRRVLGDEAPDTLWALHGMSSLLRSQGKLSEAEPYVREALETRRRVLGDKHPTTLDSIADMGSLLYAQGKLSEAEPYLREAVETRRRVLGDEHPATLASINSMSGLLWAQGKLSEAEPYQREALETHRRELGEAHSVTLDSINTMGDLLRAQGKHQEAIDLLAPAEPAVRAAFAGGYATGLADFLFDLGLARAGLGWGGDAGRFTLAEANLLEAHRFCLAAEDRGAAHHQTLACVQALVDLYTAWDAAVPGNGCDVKAEEWRERLGPPGLDELAGRAGPTFVNTSCVACHVEAGRSLPPEVGQPLDRALVRVAADAGGTPHPLWGEELRYHSIGCGDELLHVEAESFTVMSGVRTEPCDDVGGGLNVGFIDAGDWMAYRNAPVTIFEGGSHLVEFRVASPEGGGSIRFEEMGGDALHATVAVPSTGGWQVWQTISATVELAAGEHRFGLNATAGGWNLNWFRVRRASGGGAGEPTPILAGWEETPGAYADGAPYSLRRPIYGFEGETPAFFSVRMAPPLIGLGLLEAVDEQTVIDLSDERDLDGDGISGRVRTVKSPLVATAQRLGRFTFKGGRDSIRHRVAYALNLGVGVTTTLEPMHDGSTTPEAPGLDHEPLDRTTRPVAPLRGDAGGGLTDPVALHGETLFVAANCSACHVPELATGSHHPYAGLRNRIIRPFTDLLLHDLGPGLADPMAEEGVLGSEWRTTPLWGIGLTEGVADGEAYLHDGRARSLEEAILWHGGEAEASKEAFRQMSAADRAALIAFLKSL